MNLFRLIGPVVAACSPRMTNLFSLGALDDLARLYHKSAQLVSVLILPTAIVVALYAKEVFLLWTQDPITAERVHLLASILLVGTVLNGLMNIPYALQLASGWTRLAFSANVVSVVLLVPLMIVLTARYGPVGAAFVWVALNAGYVIFIIPIMHRRLLPAEKWRWYLEDVGLPAGVTLLVAGLSRLLLPVPSGGVGLGAFVFGVLVVTLFVTAMAVPASRMWIKEKIFVRRALDAVTL